MISKTPIVIPLRDENAPNIFGGKLGPRNRAPLGIKTTNAKVQAFQTPARSATKLEQENLTKKATTTRRPRKLVHADNTKLVIQGGDSFPSELDIEYCPPTPKNLPYESDSFPDNCLDYSTLRPENLVSDLYKKNLKAQIDERGLSLLEKEQEEAYQKRLKHMDEAVLKSMEEKWTVEDMPEKFGYQPKRHNLAQPTLHDKMERKNSRAQYQGISTLTSKSACIALSTIEKSTKIQPKKSSTSKPSFLGLSRTKSTAKPLFSQKSENKCYSISNTTSRSTIGYSKGRDVPKIFKDREQIYQGKTNSTKSTLVSLGATSRPEALVKNYNKRRPSFLKVYDVDEEEIEPALRGIPPDCIRNGEKDEEFFITV